MRSASLLWGVVFAGCAFLTGCGKSESHSIPENEHIKNVVVLYGQYLGRHKGQPPKDELSFKKFVQDTITSRQANATVDEWLTSPRDKEPYVIRYGVLGKSDKAIFVHEKTGKNGKRFVGFATGGIEEVDEAKFSEMIAAK